MEPKKLSRQRKTALTEQSSIRTTPSQDAKHRRKLRREGEAEQTERKKPKQKAPQQPHQEDHAERVEKQRPKAPRSPEGVRSQRVQRNEKPSRSPIRPVEAVSEAAATTILHQLRQDTTEDEQENSGIAALHQSTGWATSVLRQNPRSRLRQVSRRRNNHQEEPEEESESPLREQPMETRRASVEQEEDTPKARHRHNLHKKQVLQAQQESTSIPDRILDTVQENAERAAVQITIFLQKNGHAVLGILAALLVALFLMTQLMSCGSVAAASMGGVLQSTWLSDDESIHAADLYYTKLESELERKLNRIEVLYPSMDEYRYNTDEVGHDPVELISYLSALHGIFQYDSTLEDELDSLFARQYRFTVSTSTVTNTVTNSDGTQSEQQRRICSVTLHADSFSTLAAGLGVEQQEQYQTYIQSRGNRPFLASPVPYYWYRSVSGHYGYRSNGTAPIQRYHVLDIAVPVNTDLSAPCDGTVTAIGRDARLGNFVTITHANGYAITYAQCQSISVTYGQTVTAGETVAVSSGTLSVQLRKDGVSYNPYYYLQAGTEPIYGGSLSGLGGSGEDSALGAAAYQRLIAEAERYLGMPYQWGGSSPSTGFDCSGFVCYVYTASGVKNIPRTTAQGLFDQCTPISPANASPGDLIFFTGTYQSSNPVTHVGIYVGGGKMLHCGDPIKYSSIETAFWQSHFYAFGRL